MGEVFYVTTPIYYVNDVPHIGTAYTTVVADAIARYMRLKGRKVFFLTGTDEHGQMVAQAAAEKNVSPQEWADRMVGEFVETWKMLNISNDDFIRTTQNRHTQVAQRFIEKLNQKGDVYLGTYEGWYCIHDETFLLSSQLADGACPECHRPVEWVKEENYFFKLSKYANAVLKHIEENPEFVQPESRRNEVISFIKSGLSDQSISRTSFTWGIPLPFDARHVMYVWFDALLNYISAIDYEKDEERFNLIWPADWHLVGKEILRFHAIVWPAMLMAAELPLPKRIFAHGWLTVEGEKMSKSLGNVIRPKELVDEYGVDAYRYYFLREFSFGQDGNFSRRTMRRRFNDELANDLGNLASRVLAMVNRYRDGIVPESGSPTGEENRLAEESGNLVQKVDDCLSNLEFNNALSNIWEFVHSLNRYVDVSAPWSLSKDKSKSRELDRILYSSLEGIRIVALLIYPFMPETAEKIWKYLGLEEPITSVKMPDPAKWGLLPAGIHIEHGEPLFPRIVEGV